MKSLCALAFLVAVSSNLVAWDYKKIPDPPGASSSSLAWLYFTNDGLGHNIGVDEDDWRTWGFSSGVSLGDSAFAAFDWECLTDRNETPSLSLRNDELKFLLGARALRLRGELWRAEIAVGLGGALYGNFGTLGLQVGAHGMDKAYTRRVPEAYDSPSRSLLAFGRGDLWFPAQRLDLGLYSHVTDQADFSVDASLSRWMVKELMQIELRASWQYNRSEAAGSVVRNVLEGENGPWVASAVFVGPAVLERGFNPLTGNQEGYAGLRFPLGAMAERKTEPGYRLTYSFGWPIGHNSNNERFAIHPFGDLARLGLYLSAYQTEDTYDAAGDRRIKKSATLGAEWHLAEPETVPFFDAFLFGGAGWDRQVLGTGAVFRTKPLETREGALGQAGIGVRFCLPDFLTGHRDRYVGAQLMVELQVSAMSAALFSNPYMLLSWAMVFSER